MSRESRREFDPITLEILWSRLISIADQAATTLVRTSFSTIVRECNDYACVLMDRNGDTLAENRGAIPSFVGTMSRTVKHFLRRFPAEGWQPGDAVITNDPWMGTGHRPDFSMATPVFRNGELVAFTGIVAHASDVGGSIFSADNRSVFEEGLGIPPMKLFSEGVPNVELFELIRYNVRVPEQVTGDFMAMVAGCEVAGQQLMAFMDEYGVEMLEALSENIQARAEAVMRRAIDKLPDGIYSHTVSLDGFDEPIHLKCTIVIEGDGLEVDFAGTSEQVDQGGVNVVSGGDHLAAVGLGATAATRNPVPGSRGRSLSGRGQTRAAGVHHGRGPVCRLPGAGPVQSTAWDHSQWSGCRRRAGVHRVRRAGCSVHHRRAPESCDVAGLVPVGGMGTLISASKHLCRVRV